MAFGPAPSGFDPAQPGPQGPQLPGGASLPQPSPPAPEWKHPSPIERRLYEAKSRGDWGAYFEELAANWIWFRIRVEGDESEGSTVRALWQRGGLLPGRWLDVYTEGTLPPPTADNAFEPARLKWCVESWFRSGELPTLLVNRGTPCEALLPPDAPHNALWQEAALRAEPLRGSGRLRALHTSPLRGEIARGLACGGLLCVSNGSLWNAMNWHGTGYAGELRRLREWWGITDREQWQRYLKQLLAGEQHSAVWDFVLSLRRSIAKDFGGHVDPGYWRQMAENFIRARSAGRTEVTPDGVTRVEPRPESETAATVEGLHRLIGRILRYETRMRADGVLDEGRYVKSVEAWDLGRASKMARWGLGARFGTVQEAEEAVIKAGRLAAVEYRNWAEFGAGYILGRCLHFDDEEFGSWYTEVADAHRTLMTEEASPWLNIPLN